MYQRIRKAREDAGYTREQFAELVNVSVSYMAEVERGRCNVSVKTLIAICRCLGLSADYLLFGEVRDADALLMDKLHRLDEKYLPLVNTMLNELLAISHTEQQPIP
jgi:transcriptional regulator with XRE-family HTH domain